MVVRLNVGDTQVFSASAIDPDGDGVALRWSLDGNQVATGASFSYSPSTTDAGLHLIDAVATDSSPLGGSTSVRWIVADLLPLPVAPSAAFTFSPSPGIVGQSVQFTDTSSITSGSVAAWSWDFGDGTTNTLQNPTHTFATPGTFTVTLQATGSGGGIAAITQTVYVQPAANVVFADTFSGPNLDSFWTWEPNVCINCAEPNQFFFSRVGLPNGFQSPGRRLDRTHPGQCELRRGPQTQDVTRRRRRVAGHRPEPSWLVLEV